MVSHLDMSVAITPPQLSTATPAHAASIAHALGQFDRAALIESSGRLVCLNVSLSPADHLDDVTFDGGTRHNSAGRYSASQHDAVVFVVSADGPVTVFHQGNVVAAIR